MSTVLAKWHFGDINSVWDHFCGFLDLSQGQFMDIQRRLWQEQMPLLAKSELGSKLLGGKAPSSIVEFQKRVPLTTYDDYEPYLTEKREDVLPTKVHTWIRTSGTRGRVKWIPFSKAGYDASMDLTSAIFILATAKARGKFSLRPGDTMLNAVAPPPWGSGVGVAGAAERLGLRLIPTFEEVQSVPDLAVRAQMGFKIALRTGLDFLPGLPGQLLRAAESMGQRRSGGTRTIPHPAMLFRILRAVAKSKMAHRPMLPKDVFKLKGITVTGADSQALIPKIADYWGCTPCEFYVNTELGGPLAAQAWNHKGMTPVPHQSFLEFIPESEMAKMKADMKYLPATRLLDEVEAGKSYELVVTNFHGGIYTRYKPGDVVFISSLKDDETGIKLPQFIFRGRADTLIDITGWAKLDERTFWLALEDAKLKCEGWMARKEIIGGRPVAHLYLESPTQDDEDRLKVRINESLGKLDRSYAEIEPNLGFQPLKVTKLAPGTFAKFEAERIAAGADPGQMKDVRMEPPADMLRRVLEISAERAKAS